MDLHQIANSGGYGTGKKARDILAAREERKKHIPERIMMNEVTVGNEIDCLVASFGNDPEDGKDYHINSTLYALIGDSSTAGEDARALAALWNAYRDGDLDWVAGRGEE